VSDLPEYVQALVRLGVVILVALVATRLCLVLVRRMQRRIEATEGPRTDLQRRSQTLASVLRGAIVVVIWTVAAITALGQAGVEVAPILAAAGIGGIALGFGAQSLVKDVLAGFFILLENQYDVGDVVRIVGVSGSVEAVNLRTTTLRDLDGSRHVVPNGLIEVSTNLTKVYSRYVLVMPVPYETDVDRAVAVLERVADDLREDAGYAEVITGSLTVLGVDAYGDSAVEVKAFLETLPGEQWRVGRELRRRLKAALDAEGIPIPYPHRQMMLRRPGDADLEP
jgi:moderate conductance mechanosensitive channel